MTPATRSPRKQETRTWPWYQQSVDAIFALVGVGVAISMVARESYPALGIVLAVACAGKVSASQIVRLLMGRWEEKP